MQSIMVPKGICDSIKEMARQLIWGASEGKQKIALVWWDTICQPRSCGGLGIRCVSDQNKAFMMKLGYNIATKTDTLWVRVLRAKYGINESLSECIMWSRSSFVWKSIVKYNLYREKI
ncbi:hypothetical protein PVK06_043378 [Gossypium arboreum]|uniref:Uncharacterized protein n=1 Tax=Gossypium arboreum TaxID=29729 RepID=A0ABR0MNF0_GOSAR|nr:hypothetical protein PVK06_043378 [Gossypium arboreum]